MGKVFARLDDVTLTYGDHVVLKNCSLDIMEGAITCVIGLSGAGKSTILHLLDALRPPDSGHVYIGDHDLCHLPERDLAALRQKISLSFQFAALLDSMTIGDNVALPLRENTELSEPEILHIVHDALESVGLAGSSELLPSELSGGMLKRAGFARSIVTRPELILYDEPTTGLDPIVTHLITNMIVALRKKLNGTAVVISQDLRSIFMMADYIAMLFEGTIIAFGTPEEIKRSDNPIVRQFLAGSEVGPIPI
ncbi:MAG: ABC transporter ATP-binding protein [Vulcanimicrobiaceae bacterium]